jgi:hypothetical protein
MKRLRGGFFLPVLAPIVLWASCDDNVVLAVGQNQALATTSHRLPESICTVRAYGGTALPHEARRARPRASTAALWSISFTPNMMLISEEPWLITSMFTPLLARAAQALAAMPTA